MTDLVRAVHEGTAGWYVPAGADYCPRCGDINWNPDTRQCITCANCTCGAAADGRGTDHRTGCPEAAPVGQPQQRSIADHE